MTQINDIKDFVAVLQEHPEWLYTVRGLMVSENIATLPDKVEALAKDLLEVKTTLAEHTAILDTHSGMLKRLTSDVNRMKGSISYLMDKDFETYAATCAPRRIQRPRDTVSLHLAYQKDRVNTQWLADIAKYSAIAGLITPRETGDLTNADMIFRRENTQKNQDYILAEASITLQEHDVRRAGRRAKLLAKALQMTVNPLTIGTAITPAAQSLADSEKVPVRLLAYRQGEEETGGEESSNEET